MPVYHYDPNAVGLETKTMSRKDKIAKSITNAITCSDSHPNRRPTIRRLRKLLRALFTLYSIQLNQHSANEFAQLRRTWSIDDENYLTSFATRTSKNDTYLETIGTMGYSGSTFFNTSDGKYLVKSVPRQFEHSFFRDDFLQPYVDYMGEHLGSLLIRIVDFLAVEDVYKYSPGLVFGFAPSHHIIMENLLVGKAEGQRKGKDIVVRRQNSSQSRQKSQDGDNSDVEEPWKWQTWDLKPTSYFFPERDIADGKLTSEATKSRLADKFEDKLVLTQSDSNTFVEQLDQDTKLLEKANAVDYSLFLVRIPVLDPLDEAQQSGASENPFETDEDRDETHNEDHASNQTDTTAGPDLAKTAPTPSKPPFTPPGPPSWRTGIKSADGKYIYRAAILDFFWAKHKTHAKMMTKLVKSWNRVDPGGSKGPMSITTSSKEYRSRFMEMCKGFLDVREQDE